MANFINLTCPSCGGKLEITNDIERFSCVYCGNEFIVKRGGGIVTLKPIIEEIRTVKRGVDRSNYELSIIRLQNNIRQLETRLDIITPKRKKGIYTLISSIPLFFVIMFLSKLSGSSGFQSLLITIVVIGLAAVLFTISKLSIEERNIKQEIDDYEEEIDTILDRIKN
ncbi:MAG: hypothetical protein CVU43_08895 [Chloroflexi bacterium HGW-Chloroflexi-5]|jgi:uncharacterized protein Yka (UPF0111/DUF47 family)|nr:MAG: hypothetical protein CVU43_08895 [Chloroflexi bacterium HGW-Chloroflexi-5]